MSHRRADDHEIVLLNEKAADRSFQVFFLKPKI